MKDIIELKKRFWEIDFLRGIAILMMITFHTLFFSNYFGNSRFNLSSGFWHIFQIATATTFLFLVGVSLTVSYSRAKKKQKTEKLFLKYFKRGLKIFALGLIITVFTRIFLRENFVRFGILHLIGISIILAYPFLKIHFGNLFLGIFFISLGIYLKNSTFDSPWLSWLIFSKLHYQHTVDYFPILPWFGVVLMGLFFGKFLYPDYTRKFKLPDLPNSPIPKFFCFSGRHSLLIYLLHQPVIIAILYILRAEWG